MTYLPKSFLPKLLLVRIFYHNNGKQIWTGREPEFQASMGFIMRLGLKNKNKLGMKAQSLALTRLKQHAFQPMPCSKFQTSLGYNCNPVLIKKNKTIIILKGMCE